MFKPRAPKLFPRSRTDLNPLRSGPVLLRKAVLAGVVTLVNSMLGLHAAKAQESESAASVPALPSAARVVVTGTADYGTDSYLLRGFTDPPVTTPQTVTVVTPQLRQDEAVTSLRDSLRNVSGISLGAGEGSYQGDNYSIRGLAGRSDTFIDGMRDFGSYFRDPFDTGNIEVLKGASSTEFGRGSSGGAINLDTKEPELQGFTTGSALYGTNDTKRGTLDFDEPVPGIKGAAFRLNLMGEDAGVTDRDFIHYDRWGVAPALAFGLGTGTRFFVNYFHQSEDDRPDYGIPYYFGQPAPVDRSNYYGFQSDFFRANVNIGTLIFEHDFEGGLTLHEQFRLASYHRSLRVTEADIPDGVTPATPLRTIDVERSPIDGISTERSVDEDINLTWRGDFGRVKNTAVGGFEYVHQFSDPRRIEPGWTGVPGTSLLDPDPPANFTGTGVVSTVVNGSLDNYSAYLIDTLKPAAQWTLLGSVRFDAVSASYEESAPPTSSYRATSETASWHTALVYQPLPNGSVYVAAGTSYHPNAEQVAVENETTLPPDFGKLPVGRVLDLEVGTKWNFLHERLSFSTAFFWEDLTNPATEDADDDLLYVTNGKEHIPGVEFGVVGRVTDRWQLLLNYTYMHARVVSSSAPALVGNPVLNAPDHTVALWTTYDLPWKFQAGFGVNHVSSRVAAESPDAPGLPLRGGPGYTIESALLKYQINAHVDLQLNVTNLSNEHYIDGIHPGHAVPGEGRTFYLSTNFGF